MRPQPPSQELSDESRKILEKHEQKGIEARERILAVKKHFEKDILGYAEYLFPHHITKEIPQFHRDLYELYTNFDIKRVAIAAPRGHAKSTVTDLVFLSWCIAYKKIHFAFIISNTLKQAMLQLETLKSEIQFNDRFKMLYGSMKTDKWSQDEIELKGRIKIFARGSGQQIRGLKYMSYRPDLVILDDLEDDELVQSKDRRDALQRWLHSEVYPAMDVQNGRILYIGTILHYDSLLNKVISQDKYSEWVKRKYKAIISETEVLWPEHLSRDALEQIKNDAVASGVGHLFYSEYQNEPRDSEMQFFKQSDWQYYEPGDLEGKLLNTFTCCDLAVSKAKLADYTAIVTVSIDTSGNYYIREIRRGHFSPKEIVDQIFLAYTKFIPHKIGVEDGVEWRTLKPYLEEEVLRRRVYLPLEELKHGGQSKKESPTRIRGLEPLYKTHAIFHLKEDPETKNLEDELWMFPSGRHDDIIDALAYILHISKIPSFGGEEYEANMFTAYGLPL